MPPGPMTGLASPGPMYQLPSCFDRAAKVSRHPTIGKHGPNSLKNSRFRTQEVRFVGNGFNRELRGHFSPGPQYHVPSALGGATHRDALTAPTRARRREIDLNSSLQNSHYWKASTTPLDVNSSVSLESLSWENAKPLGLQTQVNPPPPRQQPELFVNDPPFATPFGSEKVADHFGGLGGQNSQWRENKVGKHGSQGVSFGPTPPSPKLRAAFVQPYGNDSVFRKEGAQPLWKTPVGSLRDFNRSALNSAALSHHPAFYCSI